MEFAEFMVICGQLIALKIRAATANPSTEIINRQNRSANEKFCANGRGLI
jgi:hypothetical protein